MSRRIPELTNWRAIPSLAFDPNANPVAPWCVIADSGGHPVLIATGLTEAQARQRAAAESVQP